MGVFKLSCLDFLLTCMGLIFLLLDISLDIWAAVSFYQEKEYVFLLVLLLLLIGSSVLVQAYSWLWYSYDYFKRETKAERSLSVCQLRLLHVLQLGIYFRHAGVIEVSFRSFFSKGGSSEDLAVFLSHDLSMLRLIETFSESAPQLVLMLTIILRRGQVGPVTVLKALGSALSIAFSVTTYHRSLRSFLPDKQKQQLHSSFVFFFWNLLLISSRITALALFAFVHPCFILTHFLCSWLVLFFFAWKSQTEFMDSPGGEWLYRGTVGLIWYFDWFSVAEGRTRYRTLLYHTYMLLDISLLCSVWCWKVYTHPYFEIPHLHAIIATVSIVLVYSLGLFFKIIYYKFCHPNLNKEELKGDSEKPRNGLAAAESTSLAGDEVDTGSSPPVILRSFDFGTDVADRSGPPAPDIRHCNKRMRKLAENFYS